MTDFGTIEENPAPAVDESPSGYFAVTRTATYGFLAALPLFLAYEALILAVNESDVSQIRVGADVWIKQVLGSLGGTGVFALGILVLLIGVAVFVSERSKRIPLQPSYFAGLIAESFFYAVVVAIIVSTMVGWLFSMFPTQVEVGTAKMLVLSIGAGLYEELVFRVVLVGGLFWVFQLMTHSKTTAYILAALIGAIAFSAVHYIGALGDPFEMSSFAFRFLFGLALNGLFLVRGFGVAAWTHALYDILVVTQLLG